MCNGQIKRLIIQNVEDFCVSIASWKRNVGRVEVKNLLTKKEENLEVEDEEEEEGKVF